MFQLCIAVYFVLAIVAAFLVGVVIQIVRIDDVRIDL